MHNLNLAENAICRFWKEEEETSLHVICHCEDLVRTKVLVNPTAHNYIKEPLSEMISIIKKAKLKGLF